MRVRPLFWLLLVGVCAGVLTLAATVHLMAPPRLRVQLTQQPTPQVPTTLLVQVTDAQGLAIDGAHLVSHAWMTNMPMTAESISTTPQGQGTYLVRLSLSMSGPWMVSIALRADGFIPLQQTMLVQVSAVSALGSPTGEVGVLPGSSYSCPKEDQFDQ